MAEDLKPELRSIVLHPERRLVPTEEQLDAVERVLGGHLPVDYRRFVRRHGGIAFEGFVEAPMVTAGSTGRPGTEPQMAAVEAFFGFYEPFMNCTDIPHDFILNWRLFADELPPKYVCIGDAYYRNKYCLSFAEDRHGWVYCWDTSERELPSRGLHLMATSFTAFLASLVAVPDE